MSSIPMYSIDNTAAMPEIFFKKKKTLFEVHKVIHFRKFDDEEYSIVYASTRSVKFNIQITTDGRARRTQCP